MHTSLYTHRLVAVLLAVVATAATGVWGQDVTSAAFSSEPLSAVAAAPDTLLTASLRADTVSADSARRMPRYTNIGFGAGHTASDGSRVKGFNLGVFAATDTLRGVQVGALSSMALHGADGFQLGGVLAMSAARARGVTVGGLMTAVDRMEGVQVGGVQNVARSLWGVQLSAMNNIAGTGMRGLQLAGVSNMAGSVERGAQVSPLLNLSTGVMRGLQLGSYNYADSLRGVQLGVINIAVSHPRGVQVGLFNYTSDSGGRKIGLVNISPSTRIDLLAFGGNTSKINAAVRFCNRSTYSIVGVGTHYMGLDKKFSGALSYRLGQYMHLSPRWVMGADLGYSHIETFEEHSSDRPRRLYSLQAHLNAEYRISPSLGAFASVGYGNTRHYGSGRLYEQKLIVQAGVALNWRRATQRPFASRLTSLHDGEAYTDSVGTQFALAPQRRPWLAAVEAAGVNALVFSYDRWIADATYSRISLHTIRHNFKTGFGWDNDPFSTNLFAHPYHGNLYFNAARSNGMTFWQSIPYALGGSLMWEFCGENEPPAINDVFATTLGGTCIGEMTNRVSHLFLDDSKRGFPRFVREALAFAVNPIQGFNRLLRGEAWRVRSDHNLYHDHAAIPVHVAVSAGLRYLADDGGLFRGECNPCVNIAMNYGDPYNERTNRPYDCFTARVNVGLSSNQPTIYGAHLMGRLWAAPVYVGRTVEARFGVYQHFNYFNSEEVKDGTGTVPYRISEAVGIGPGLIARFLPGRNLESVEQSIYASAIVLGGSKSDYFKVIDRDYNMGSGYSFKTRTRVVFRRAGYFALNLDYYRIFTWKGIENIDTDDREPLYYNVQGDKSNAELAVINPLFFFNIGSHWGTELSATYYLRNTRYDYHPDVHANTFDFKVGLKCIF